MITEIAIIGAVCGAVAIADQQNVFQNNVEKKWFWERPPFVPVPVAPARFRTQTIPMAQSTGEQRVIRAQQAIGNATREIYQGVQQQIQETKVSNGLSKYVLTN